MAKHPMDDALSRAEAYLQKRRSAQRLADAAPELLLLVRRILLQPQSAHDSTWVVRARAAIARATEDAP
jgi:hypothetical protein